MKNVTSKTSQLQLFSSLAFLCSLLLFGSGCQKVLDEFHHPDNNPPQALGTFKQVNLVGNNGVYGAARIDPALINAWGLAFSSGGTAWIGAQGSGVSTVYDKGGAQVLAPVNIPSPAGPTKGNPTGVVFNSSNADFILSNGQVARFLFVGVDGILSGWNGAAGSNALLIKNNSATAAYTGLAIASNKGENFLYAANFRAGKIDVFNRLFNAVLDKPFNDPFLPSGYSPFNIQAIGDMLYVTYAKVGPDGRDEKGVGNGVVDIYDTGGNLVKRFAAKGKLNSPWGVAQAPASFFTGAVPGGAVLIGNFGDGRINAYRMDGTFLGQLSKGSQPIEIEGLWALSFAPATAAAIDPNRLYFTAGPDDEEDGLFGYLIKK